MHPQLLRPLAHLLQQCCGDRLEQRRSILVMIVRQKTGVTDEVVSVRRQMFDGLFPGKCLSCAATRKFLDQLSELEPWSGQ